MRSLPHLVEDTSKKMSAKLSNRPVLAKLFCTCYSDVLLNHTTILGDKTVFISSTYDDVMSLRDSSLMFNHLLPLAKNDSDVSGLFRGYFKKCLNYMSIDLFSDLFNRESNGNGHTKDITKQSPWVYQRKYQADIQCFPMLSAYKFWKNTGLCTLFDEDFIRVVGGLIGLWAKEQKHHEKSPYSFIRNNTDWDDTLHNDGKGFPVNYTGMTWCGFRPDEKACVYGFNIPANMLIVHTLHCFVDIFTNAVKNADYVTRSEKLAAEIENGINVYGTRNKRRSDSYFLYETDGFGNDVFYDSPSFPNLITMPYFECCAKNDPMYLSTRKLILGDNNSLKISKTPANIALIAMTGTEPGDISKALSVIEQKASEIEAGDCVTKAIIAELIMAGYPAD